ncbi:uncharacterized protein LOC763063 isoform X4 [Strongylocentrotus purpuratus]|uniref:Uncharacterized protein n=1 Tax=Strongylocentrotus purpuratus TaxID=7668 RepID=A0A7M7NII8_STRPU|nr:uncharacterized protein LOC763063 isoform X4 [Strongylocentrotus purpuratus]
MFSLSTSSQTKSKTFQFDPSRGLDFENDIKVLRRSRLTKLSEFMTMLLSAERFQRDAKLSSLTRKDKNQLAQQAEDAQFFRILLRMLMEVSRASGLKQRDDLKKVYHWYQLNKEVLHCEPHFKGAGKQMYKRPELKFTSDAIKYYSDPPGRRKNHHVAFQTPSQQNSPRGQGSDDLNDLRIDSSRPTTAPPGMHRPKIRNSLRSPRSGDDDASFAVNYINSYLNNHLSPTATGLDRPASAMSVIRHAQIASQQTNQDEEEEDDLGSGQSAHYSQAASLASESNISIPVPEARRDGDEKKDENEEEEDSEKADDDDGENPSEGEKEQGPGLFKRKPPLTSLVNPVAQATFEEESFYGALPPEISEGTLLRVQVDMPKTAATKQHPGPSEAERKAAHLQQWQDYQHKQGVAAGDGTPGVDEGGERVVTTEVPERFTQEVIVNYAAQESFVTDNAPHIPANSLASQSLEHFYKMTESHEPKVDQNPISTQSALRLQKSQEAKKVTIAEGTSNNTRQRSLSARMERPSTVQAASLVMLADHVGDNMMVEKEPNGPEMPAGFRRPSSKVTPKRPATAPSTNPISVSVAKSYGGRSPPPNSSGDSTPEYTPRNRRGEPIFALPEESDYNVHFRRQGQAPLSTTVPHSISRHQGSMLPEAARYKWRDDGYGNMTYRKIHSRIQSAPAQRTSLRTAGSTRGGNRPKTASEASTKNRNKNKNNWHPCKVCEDNIRLPQAASHRMKTMHPATVASMMSIKTLGSDQRRMSSRMGHHHTGAYPWEEELVAGSVPPNMQYMSISTPAAIKVRNATDGSLAPNQSTESLVPKDSLHSPSKDSSHPCAIQGWFMGDSSAGETADGPPSSNQGGDNASSTMMAPSERSFGGMSDIDLADLTDQTLSPADTPRTMDSGDGRAQSRLDLSVGNGIGELAQDMEIPQADNDSQRGMPDMATKEAEDSSENTPRSVGGNSSIADTPCSSRGISQAADEPEATSSDNMPRETIVQGEPDQTSSEQLVAESKLDEVEADPTGSDETGAKQEESDAEQAYLKLSEDEKNKLKGKHPSLQSLT